MFFQLYQPSVWIVLFGDIDSEWHQPDISILCLFVCPHRTWISLRMMIWEHTVSEMNEWPRPFCTSVFNEAENLWVIKFIFKWRRNKEARRIWWATSKMQTNTKADLRSSIDLGNWSVHLISALHILEYLNLSNSLLWSSCQRKCTLNEGMKGQEARGSKQVNWYGVRFHMHKW